MELTEIYANADAKIALDEVNRYIQVTWLKHPSSESFRHIQLLALSSVIEKQLVLWLCNMCKIVYLEVEDQNWLVRKVFSAFDPDKQHEFAYVVGTEGTELFTTFHIHDLVENDPQLSKILHIEIFFDEDIARQWLLDQTKHIIRFNVI